MTIRMDEGAAELLDTLHRAGYAAYVVGGCVRDSLLGLTPHDWDLCTSALPQQVMELFGAQRCIPTGLQHGTVTVKQGGALYEITTFRTEGTYTDGRHPDEVHFVPDVREDLARRDLTINAMAYNEKRGPCGPLWRAGRPAKWHRTGGGCAPPAVHRGRAAHPAAVPLRSPVWLCHRPAHGAGGTGAVRPSGLRIGGAHRGRACKAAERTRPCGIS